MFLLNECFFVHMEQRWGRGLAVVNFGFRK